MYTTGARASQKMKRGVAQGEGPSAQKKQLALCLLRAQLVEIGKLGLFQRRDGLAGVGLVVELEGVVGVGKVLLVLSLNLRVRLDPVEELGVFAGVFVVSRLVRLEGLVVAPFFSSSAACPLSPLSAFAR